MLMRSYENVLTENPIEVSILKNSCTKLVCKSACWFLIVLKCFGNLSQWHDSSVTVTEVCHKTDYLVKK